MHVDLYLLRADGVKLRRAQLQEPLRGHLRISTWVLADGQTRRRVRQAELQTANSPSAPVLASLYDFELNRLDANGLVLAGWSDIEHVQHQGWWCLPVARAMP